MGKVLIIVDVQKEFDEYIQHDLVDSLSKYAEKFDRVFQIWDTHDSNGPTHSFPRQLDSIPKKFGNKHFSDEVKGYIKQIEDSSEEGRTFKLSDGEGYIVRVDNNHDWFYVNPEIIDLIKNIKGDKVILAGGADGECLEDVYQAFLAFGLKAHINKKYTYSAKTSDDDSIQDVKESKVPIYPHEKLIFKVNSVEEKDFFINELSNLYPDKKITIAGTTSEVSYPNWLFIPLTSVRTRYEVIVSWLNVDSNDDLLQSLFDAAPNNYYDKDVLSYRDVNILKTIVDTGKRRKPPTYTPRKMIYEVNNSKEDAAEICVKVSSMDEYNILDDLLISLDEQVYKKRISAPSGEDVLPMYYFFVFNKELLTTNNQLVSWYDVDDEDEVGYIEKGDFDYAELEGVYDHLFTVDEIHEIGQILKNQTLAPRTPNYDRKNFIYESQSTDKVLVFEPNSESESVKAQEIAFTCGFGWGYNHDQEILYTSLEQAKLISFHREQDGDIMLRVPSDFYNRILNEQDGDITKTIKYCVGDGDIIHTDNLTDFKKLMGVTIEPNYDRKKLKY